MPMGHPMNDFTAIEQLATQGKKIQAIKEFRTVTRVGLKDAKEAVEWFQRNGQWPDQYLQTPPPEDEPQSAGPLDAAEQFMHAGKKIHAIKELRALTSWGLKDSKAAVDAYQAHGRWPQDLLEAVGGGSAQGAATPAPAPTSGRLAEVEQSVAQGRKIMAIKVLRECTGFGLRDSKDAVEHYQAHGVWTPTVLEALGGSTPAPAPSVPSPSVPSPATVITTTASDPERAAMLAVLGQHLGRPPDVRLAVRAQRVPYEGYLVMLGDRACFVRKNREQWLLDPVLPTIWYAQITAFELDHSLGTDLHVSMGHIHEWFSGMEPQDAEAALAMLSVVAP